MRIPNSLIGCQVYQVKFDYQTALLLCRHDGGNSTTRIRAWLVIETPFALRSRDGSVYKLHPGTSRSALAPVIDLFLATVASVSVEGHGTLTLDFTDGEKFTVPLDETYEFWALSGDGVPGILVGQGGETDWTEELRRPVCNIDLNACHVLSNAPRRVCWRDGAYVNLNRVKLIIERYSSHAAFCNVTAPLTCGYIAV